MTDSKVYVCELSEEDKNYVAAYLNETDDVRSIKIEELRTWILENKDLHAPTDDFTILRFLRACKFNMERTKYKFRNFYKQRSVLPDWYGTRDPFLPEVQEMLNLGVFLPLRKLNSDGKMVVVIRAAVHNPSKHKQSDVLKAGLMILDLAMRDSESVSIHGIIAILDLDGVTAGHALQLQPSLIKNLVHAWQGCYPLRIQSLDFVNAPVYVNVVLKIFRSFMTAKLKSRVHVHMRGMKAFCSKLPPSILPVEYGGTDGTLMDLIEYWKAAAEDNKQWFAKEEEYKMISHS